MPRSAPALAYRGHLRPQSPASKAKWSAAPAADPGPDDVQSGASHDLRVLRGAEGKGLAQEMDNAGLDGRLGAVRNARRH